MGDIGAGKRLFRVAVEGEIWLMAETGEQAKKAALLFMQDEAPRFDFYVYPILPKPELIDQETRASLPHAKDPNDERTVGDHLNERACASAPAVRSVFAAPAANVEAVMDTHERTVPNALLEHFDGRVHSAGRK